MISKEQANASVLTSIRHCHISHNEAYLPPKKSCISFGFNFSWDGCYTQEKWKTQVTKTLGVQIRCIMENVEVAYEWKNKLCPFPDL